MAEETVKTVKGEQQEALTIVLLRNAFYRDNYRRVVFALLIVFLINVLLVTAIIYRFLNPPQPQYFATNSQYQLIKYHPLSDPVVNNNFVLQWVADAVRQSFSLDFIHWRQQLQQASNNFTTPGWTFFLAAYKQSGDLTSLVNLKMVADATVTAAPVIQYENVLDGRYVWKIQLPVMITYTNGMGKIINQPLKVTVIVVRVPVSDNPNQIAINEFLPVVQAQ
ncbi:MAG: IcmL protein [uncultured bacterium]|nr:MAG: IcmL protein [uncultured bacterium]